MPHVSKEVKNQKERERYHARFDSDPEFREYKRRKNHEAYAKMRQDPAKAAGHREANRRFYHERVRTDPEKNARYNARTLAWYHAHHDEVRERQYGLPRGQYNVMLAAQEGRCAICLVEPPPGKHRLAVDHDHVTGRVRGLLCKDCNKALGTLKDSPQLLWRALEYVSGRIAES